MAASTYFTIVQANYIAYYARPADPVGLNFWANRIDQSSGNAIAIVNAFAASEEFALNYAGLTDVQYINAIYVNLFGRNAEAAGLNFYAQQLANGTLTRATMPLDILNGATGADRDIVNNKIFASKEFTAQLDTTDEIVAYNEATKQLAIDWLATVTAVPATAVAAVADIPNVIDQMVGTSAGGKTFSLTVNEDNFLGTPEGDVFNAPAVSNAVGTLVSTLQSVDTLDGNGGLDTLNATLVSGAGPLVTATPTMTSVDTVKVRFADGGGTLNLLNTTGTTTLEATNSTAAGTFTNTGDIANLHASNQNVGVTFDGNKAATLNFDFSAVGSTGAGAIPVTVTTAATAAKTANAKLLDAYVDLKGTGAAGFETLSIAASGKNELTTASAATVKTVTVTGAGSLDLKSKLTAAETFVAKDNTGGVKAVIDNTVAGKDVTVTGGSGKDEFSVGGTAKLAVDLGAGDDKLTVTSDPVRSGNVYNGGDGTDTFRATTDQLEALGTALGAATPTVTFQKFEAVGVTDQLSKAIDLTKFGVGSVELAQGSKAGGVVNGLANAATVTILGATTALTLNQTDTDANSLTLKIGTDKSTGISVTGVTADTVETLNVVSNGDGTGFNTLRFAGTDLTSVTVTGKEALDFGNTGGALTTLDGSAMEKGLTTGTALTATTGTANVAYAQGTGASDLKAITVKGGAGDDILFGDSFGGTKFQTFSITGGAGNDKVSGGGFADTLNGDAGNDQLFGRAGNDTLSGGDGDDQDWGGAGADTMTGVPARMPSAIRRHSSLRARTSTRSPTSRREPTKLAFVSAMLSAGKINFLGNVANTNDALTALDIASKDAVTGANAVYDQTAKQVLVAASGQATPDMAMTLTGVSTLAQSDFLVL